MNRFFLLIIAVAALCAGYPAGAGAGGRTIKMSTTTSTQASGLLDVLLPEFTRETGITVKVIAKGTGAAIRDGMDGNVDLIFVHARERELEFVARGYGTKRYAVMHNDFVIAGPPADPAGIRGSTDAVAALKKIAAARAFFVSRGDDSGTHTREQSLWRQTGVPLREAGGNVVKKGRARAVSFVRPAASSSWYLSIGQGMGKALRFADEKRAYLLADRGTYLKYTLGTDRPIDLDILCQGDARLENPYGVIPVNPERHPQVRAEEATIFAQWLVSGRGQKLIGSYKLFGRQLFFPDAADAR